MCTAGKKLCVETFWQKALVGTNRTNKGKAICKEAIWQLFIWKETVSSDISAWTKERRGQSSSHVSTQSPLAFQHPEAYQGTVLSPVDNLYQHHRPRRLFLSHTCLALWKCTKWSCNGLWMAPTVLRQQKMALKYSAVQDYSWTSPRSLWIGQNISTTPCRPCFLVIKPDAC